MAAYHPAKENGTARLCFPSGTVFALSVKQVEFFGVLFQIKSLPITHVSVKRVKQKQNPGSVLSRDRTVTLPYKYQGLPGQQLLDYCRIGHIQAAGCLQRQVRYR